jgi:very-short-patch-repair endonuclease
MLKGDKLKAAKRMWRSPTAPERLLWEYLRDRRLEGIKFRRQVPLGPYIADFYCHAHRLVVEADGPFHDAERDNVRDEWMRAEGLLVLRFPIEVIQAKPYLIFNEIKATARMRQPPPALLDQRFFPAI